MGAKRKSKKKLRRRITPTRMKKAIKGSGGVKTIIAQRLGCYSGTVGWCLKKEGEDWDEVREHYREEVESVGDLAEVTVRETMSQRLEMGVASTTARWYLDRRHPDRGYGKKEELTLQGGRNPIQIENQTLLPIHELELDLATKKKVLAAMKKWKKERDKANGKG